LGYVARNNGNIRITDNYIASGASEMTLEEWNSGTVTGNTFFSTSSSLTGFRAALLTVRNAANVPSSAFSWNNNNYFDTTTTSGTSSPFAYSNDGTAPPAMTFAQWKSATGWDSGGQYVRSRPTGTTVFVRPNQYEPGRANIAVYNWDLAASVNVNVSGILPVGALFEVRNVQNYFGPPVLSGTYTGQLLTLPMTGGVVVPPIGLAFTPQSMSPEFGVFVLIKR
jgi:hypothetical protein